MASSTVSPNSKAAPQPITVDDIDIAPDDKASYDSDLASYTTSISSSVLNYKYTNGRRYHAYKEGSYVFPNDEEEADRLDTMHMVIKLALGGLHLAPVKDPKRVLDIGTGTGIWALEMGDALPNASILGNDLSEIQPRWVPSNVRFEIDDVEADWTYTSKFDFIHCRTMYGSIVNWPTLVRKCFENTTPRGYCEFTDYDSGLYSPDNTIEEGSALDFQYKKVNELVSGMGREPSPGPKLEQWVKDAGFEDVHVKKIPIPLGAWAKDKRLKEIGSWMYLNLYEGAESFTTYLFTTMLGMSKEEIKAQGERFRAQIKDPKVHTLMYLYNVYGRKPA